MYKDCLQKGIHWELNHSPCKADLEMPIKKQATTIFLPRKCYFSYWIVPLLNQALSVNSIPDISIPTSSIAMLSDSQTAVMSPSFWGIELQKSRWLSKMSEWTCWALLCSSYMCSYKANQLARLSNTIQLCVEFTTNGLLWTQAGTIKTLALYKKRLLILYILRMSIKPTWKWWKHV